MTLFDYLKQSGEAVLQWKEEHPFYSLTPTELNEGTFVYFERGGKRLRPAICRLAAALTGGEEAEKKAVPCALALELYHNWTLIHDDLIDHDDLRRGKKAVHRLVADAFSHEKEGEEYGRDLAILAGDALHSAAVYYLTQLTEVGVDAQICVSILRLLEGQYGPRLISGETVDTKNGLFFHGSEVLRHKEEDVIRMMQDKTGALFAICAIAGAMIGTGQSDAACEQVQALGRFAENCGIAFQLQDDILGITSTETALGKPICSDLREGKATVLLLHAYHEATAEEKEFLSRTVGVSKEKDEILAAREILLRRGGVSYTEKLANSYLAAARRDLDLFPSCEAKELLEQWRLSMLNRTF